MQRTKCFSLSLRLVLPCAILFLLLSTIYFYQSSYEDIPLTTNNEESLFLQPPAAVSTLAIESSSPQNISIQSFQGNNLLTRNGDDVISFSRWKHFLSNETLSILKDLGNHDHYNGAALRCNAGAYREPRLYWYDYPSSTSSHHHHHNNEPFNASRRLLIVQSAGFGTYAQLLDLTAPINKAYARKWKQTMLVLQGTLVVLDEEKARNCTPPEHRSTHNKMQLLKFGLHLRDHYDYLLILDADAMIYDFSIDLSNLMPPRAMLAANRAIAKKGIKKRATWKINAGVTLWNLHHAYTAAVANGWTQAAVGFMNGRNNNQGDQLFLYHVLKNNASIEGNVYSFGKEFNYNKATVIKHVKRPHVTYEIGETSLDSRSEIISKFTKEICDNFPADCQNLDRTTYIAL